MHRTSCQASAPSTAAQLRPRCAPTNCWRILALAAMLHPWVLVAGNRAAFSSQPRRATASDDGAESDGEPADTRVASSLLAFRQSGQPSASSAPRRRRRSSTSQPRVGSSTRSLGSARAASSAAPNMLGDTSAGGCATFGFQTAPIQSNLGQFGAAAQTVTISHPAFACSRANLAENNSPVPRDRIFFSYRHFHNASSTNVLGNVPHDLNINRYTLGFEKRLGEGNFSLGLLAPLNEQLSSNLAFSRTRPGGPGTQALLNHLPLADTDTQWGNLTAIGKIRWLQTSTFFGSIGLGVGAPTAPRVRLDGLLNDPAFPLDPQNPLAVAPVQLQFTSTVFNQTVNLTPYLAGLWTPNDRLFAHGFFQIDVPTNPSRFDLSFTPGSNLAGVPLGVNQFTGRLHQQTLLRLNLGAGMWHYRNPHASLITGLATMVEVHYTTTLQDAVLTTPTANSGNGLISVVAGNMANRVDIVNLAISPVIQLGQTSVQNGFVIPLSTLDNRPFNFEYALLVNRRF